MVTFGYLSQPPMAEDGTFESIRIQPIAPCSRRNPRSIEPSTRFDIALRVIPHRDRWPERSRRDMILKDNYQTEAAMAILLWASSGIDNVTFVC
jgi:hypothetical protein